MSKLKYGMATASAIAAFVGVAGLSLPQALAGNHMGASQASDLGAKQQSLLTERARIEYAMQKQECDTLKNSKPEGYEPCLEKALSTRDNLLTQTQGSEPAGQGSQGFASNQSQQQFSGQKQGPIDKMTSAVKETVAEVKETLFGRSDQEQQGQGQSMGSGQQGGVTQGHMLQRGFEAGHTQGQGSGQGGQTFGQQEVAQAQQSPGQQGLSGQGSVQGGNYDQQAQGQPCPQGTGGTNQQFQSGGTQGSSNVQGGSTSGSAGAVAEHMDPVEYYQGLARQQYATLNQECNTLKQDANVYEQCQKYAESVRDEIAGMAEQG